MNGREYLVAPLSMIVPGVLAGSKGPLYYPPSETAADPGAWNGIPLVVYHPTFNGVHVSARDPEVLAKSHVGQVFRSHIARDGRLAGEAWFEVEATRRVDARVLNALEAGQPIEISTGLFTDNEPAPPGSTCLKTGRPYDYIARNYRPDHLAILPDQVGACSIADGCGVLVNQLVANTMGGRYGLADGSRSLVGEGTASSPSLPPTRAALAPLLIPAGYGGFAMGPGPLPDRRAQSLAVNRLYGDDWYRHVNPLANCGGEGGKPGPCPKGSGVESASSSSEPRPTIRGRGSPSDRPEVRLSRRKELTDTGNEAVSSVDSALDAVPTSARGVLSQLRNARRYALSGQFDKATSSAREAMRTALTSSISLEAKSAVTSAVGALATAREEQSKKTKGGKERHQKRASYFHVKADSAKAATQWQRQQERLGANVSSAVAARTLRSSLAKAGAWLEKNGLMPGYGQIFFLPDAPDAPESGAVWYVGGDGDEKGFGDLVEERLGSLSGINKVIYEAEAFPPKGEGWEQVYPKSRPGVRNVRSLTTNCPGTCTCGGAKPCKGMSRAHVLEEDDLTEEDIALGKDARRQKKATGHNPAFWVADEGIWEKAKAAADKGDYEKGSDRYWAVVAHIYKNMGGKKKKGKEPTSNVWSPLTNAFCPTGPGGGIDPTCSPSGESRGYGGEKAVTVRPGETLRVFHEEGDELRPKKLAALAFEASEKAKKSGLAEDHDAAVQAHVKAAKAYWGSSPSLSSKASVRYHQLAAAGHRESSKDPYDRTNPPDPGAVEYSQGAHQASEWANQASSATNQKAAKLNAKSALQSAQIARRGAEAGDSAHARNNHLNAADFHERAAGAHESRGWRRKKSADRAAQAHRMAAALHRDAASAMVGNMASKWVPVDNLYIEIGKGGRGQPCKPGQTVTHTGCIPAGGEGEDRPRRQQYGWAGDPGDSPSGRNAVVKDLQRTYGHLFGFGPGDTARRDDLRKALKRIFAISTLGTGPLAIGALKVGIRHSPKAFGLLAKVVGGVAKVSTRAVFGRKQAEETEGATYFGSRRAGSRSTEPSANVSILARYKPLFDRIEQIVKEDPEEAKRFNEAILMVADELEKLQKANGQKHVGNVWTPIS